MDVCSSTTGGRCSENRSCTDHHFCFTIITHFIPVQFPFNCSVVFVSVLRQSNIIQVYKTLHNLSSTSSAIFETSSSCSVFMFHLNNWLLSVGPVSLDRWTQNTDRRLYPYGYLKISVSKLVSNIKRFLYILNIFESPGVVENVILSCIIFCIWGECTQQKNYHFGRKGRCNTSIKV